MTAHPVLYSFRRCPYAMRARMAVAVSDVQVELREVVLRDKPTEMLEVSSKGTVPVLVLANGQVLEESLDIMHWAIGINASGGWLANVDEALIAANDGPFKRALDRYKYPHRHALTGGVQHRDAAMAHLTELDGRLASSLYLAGGRPGFTDIALFPFVRQFAATDQAWFDAQPLSALKRWLSDLLQSEFFERIMTRYPQWKLGDVPLIFPDQSVMPAKAGI